MRFFAIITVTVLLIAAMYIGERLLGNNQGTITAYLLSSKPYEISTSTLFLMAMAIGGGIIFSLYLLRDIRRFLRGLEVQRERKKRLKIHEHYSKGLNSLLAKRNSDAIRFFQRVLAIDPHNVDALLRLGISQLREKNLPEAILLHQKALTLDPENIEVMFSL